MNHRRRARIEQKIEFCRDLIRISDKNVPFSTKWSAIHSHLQAARNALKSLPASHQVDRREARRYIEFVYRRSSCLMRAELARSPEEDHAVIYTRLGDLRRILEQTKPKPDYSYALELYFEAIHRGSVEALVQVAVLCKAAQEHLRATCFLLAAKLKGNERAKKALTKGQISSDASPAVRAVISNIVFQEARPIDERHMTKNQRYYCVLMAMISNCLQQLPILPSKMVQNFLCNKEVAAVAERIKADGDYRALVQK